MGNPLFNQFAPKNDAQQIIEEAKKFKNNFKGDARAEVQRLLNEGTMTQSQFNYFLPIAQQIASMMPKR